MRKNNLHFITYGSNDFRIAKKHLINLAKQSEIFKTCRSFGFKDLNAEFKNKHSDILKFKRGGGYWIWKHEIIYNSLKEIKNDDFVIYSDAGSTFNDKGRKRFFEYINLLSDSNFGIFIMENESENYEYKWTTKELFNFFKINSDSAHYNSVQKEATHLIFKKNEHSLFLLNEFKKLLNYDQWLITDKYIKNQSKEFIENRWDQSIFSLLSKKYGCETSKNETHFKNNINLQYNYPFLAVRRHGHGITDTLKFFTNYKKFADNPAYFK